MNCKRVVEIGVNEKKFNEEIISAIKCISRVKKINNKAFTELSNEVIKASINGRNLTYCVRKIYQFKKNDTVIGILECYMSVDKSFIEIFHH